MSAYSYINNAHPSYIEALYQSYKQSAESVDQEWSNFFAGFDYALDNNAPIDAEAVSNTNNILKELKVYNLINAYRHKGHLESNTNPIKKRKDRGAHLQLSDFGLSENDLQEEFTMGRELGLGTTTLANILKRLKEVYLGTIGFEFGYITDPTTYNWLLNKIESFNGDYHFPVEKKERILHKLNETVVFENFLHKKYIGQKRFSLEGGESTIPALDAAINKAGDLDVEEVVIGMAHRGRLNVLANIMGKTYKQIFNEFEGNDAPEEVMVTTMGDGDVKYHLGFSSMINTHSSKKMFLRLVPNPSHLEAVDPVVEGFARAQADAIYNSDYDKILPIIIHGDAAVAGQGVVYEVVQMSKLDGYYTGGTIHFIINNQIGFTTDFDDARSADYSTSIASMIKAPVIHINGDDVESVVYAIELAAEYRQKFNSDIFIDMVCYRRHGHNEGDDPKYTQPDMYNVIARKPNPREIYSNKLVQQGKIEANLAKSLEDEFWSLLQERLDEVKQTPLPYQFQKPEIAWKKLRNSERADFDLSPITGISKDKVNQIVAALVKVPEGFTPLRKVNKMLDKRRKTMKDNQSLDWAAAEMIAYGSILMDGQDIRMSGQDVKRGTFSHRHAILYDDKTLTPYNRLNHISEEQGRFMIYNSFLSEFAVLGFEYGYSLASPETLTLWEAQFGDFANGAQTIIDQFIASSETKWRRNSGIVLLLPHGYEGQGPEHSSARLERFLQASAKQNITVVNITDPANFFHVLRRQQQRPFRKPLVVMSPKSLLRHPKCVSSIFDIIGDDKKFKEIIDDPFVEDKKAVKRVLMCSGKVYYDLAAKQESENRHDIAIVRIEQLYPLATYQLLGVLKQYSNASFTWVQEEPANMGALWHMMFRLRNTNIKFDFVARKNSASPATGYKKQHEKEQHVILERSFKVD